ncbi:MAG: flavodoxin family protein [Peptococcaceae bacterium]|jgi:multimeric flavodoxin WrbA|nr:flavodoxin family protein [Peptococcaceae bacterium]
MTKKVFVISSSLRNHSNSESLADAFLEGAAAAGHQVEKVSLKDKNIAFCKGCLACREKLKCVITDDAIAIAEKMKVADVIAFATPIYYYEMSGQLKTLLDRANPLYSSGYDFREIYLLSAAEDDEDGVDEGVIHGLGGWIACHEKCHLAGTVFAGGVTDAGDIKGHAALEKAYEMGKSI